MIKTSIDDKVHDWKHYLDAKLRAIKEEPFKGKEAYFNKYSDYKYFTIACNKLYEKGYKKVAQEYMLEYSRVVKLKEQELWDWWI